MPDIPGRRWWPAYLDIPEENRPHFSNYTVADFRAHCLEMDIDLVLHRGPDGELEGPAAIWACAAEPGEELAILDQGVMFDRPDDASDLLIVADESGLPATAGILRSLPDGVTGLVIQEVPTASDRRALRTPSGMTVRWVIRAEVEAPDGSIPGRAALAHLHEHTDVDPTGYAFVVGESTLATQGRRHLVRRGMPKGRITFSGFWKHAGTPA
jgi:NADPH-dependent ferric siderophore reductase